MKALSKEKSVQYIKLCLISEENLARVTVDKKQTEDEEEMQEEQTEDTNEEEEQDNMQDQEGEERGQLEGHGRNADKEQEGQNDDEDVVDDDYDGVSSDEEDSDDELCLLCGEHDRPGDGTIDWINCTELDVNSGYMKFAYCLDSYCFDKEDDDFACSVCLAGQKYV